MNYYEAPKIADAYLGRIVDMMEGRRDMPRVSYPPLGKELHAHDLDGLCILQAIYKRTWINPPKPSPQSCILFMRGRVFERAMAEESAPMEVDGITMRLDDNDPPCGLVVSEIKTTEWGMHFFDPVKNCPWWINRAKVYCYGAKDSMAAITTVFLSGNKDDFKSWKKDERPPAGTERIKAGIRSWILEFEQEELDKHWEWVMGQKRLVEDAMNQGILPPIEMLKEPPKWLCRDCDFAKGCEYRGNFKAEKQLGATA
jgi:hypothetical protein